MKRRQILGAMLSTLLFRPAVSAANPAGTNSQTVNQESPVQPEQIYFKDDGVIPNSRYPVLFYRQALSAEGDTASRIEDLFRRNGWPPRWRYSVFPYHHYHPNAHEVLGIASGSAKLMLGGEHGQVVEVRAGDIVVLPAGTGHRNVGASSDFLVVGGYPEGQGSYATNRAEPDLHAEAVRRIAAVPLPGADPVGGVNGALLQSWKSG